MKIINNTQYSSSNMLSLKKYVDKKRISFNIIVCIITIITIYLISYYVINTSKNEEKSRQFVSQLTEYQKQRERQEGREQLEQTQQVQQKVGAIAKTDQQNEGQLKLPKLTQQGKDNLDNIYHSETKRAFLTFDDGPSQNTNEILNILKQYNIKATFFVLGTQAEVMPETIKRIYNEGHYLANHGYTHIYSSIYQSPEQVLIEYNQCNQIIANAIQVPEYNSHLFRFPGGFVGGKYAKIKEQAGQLLEQNDILNIDWNSLTGDSEKVNPSEEYLMNNLYNTTNGKNSVVILMHDALAKKVTVNTLPSVIEYLKNQGYEFDNFYSIIK